MKGVMGREDAIGSSTLIQHREAPFHVIAMVHKVLFHLQIPAACRLQRMASKKAFHDCAHRGSALILGRFGNGPQAGPVRVEVSHRRVSHRRRSRLPRIRWGRFAPLRLSMPPKLDWRVFECHLISLDLLERKPWFRASSSERCRGGVDGEAHGFSLEASPRIWRHDRHGPNCYAPSRVQSCRL